MMVKTAKIDRLGVTLMSVIEDMVREGWFIKVAKHLCRNWPEIDCQDIAQDGAIAGFKAVDTFRDDAGISTLRGWIKYKSEYAMLDSIKTVVRRSKFRSFYSIHDYDDILTQTSAEFYTNATHVSLISGDIVEAVDSLPHEQRKYVIARFFEGANEREISGIMGHNRSAAKFWWGASNARHRLSRQLKHLADFR